MIIFFHCFANFIYELYKKYIEEKNVPAKISKSPSHPLAQRDAENGIKFDPPVAKQRYERVSELLLNEKWRSKTHKVVDFGCSTFGLFLFLKHSMGLSEIVFVDIDEMLLRDYLFRIYPLNADYLDRRSNAMTVKVFSGSIADPDPSLRDTDAVIAIELIEHLYPDVLEAVPYNVFSYIEPKVAIITTPNVDFNVVFPNKKSFRHPDHKFEWSREEFQSWAINLTVRFPNYSVSFDGIGLGPEGTESLGCCTQLALFVRKDVICDNYVKEDTFCICTDAGSKTSKGQYHGECCCVCSDCLPKSSYGICTYFSRSLLSDASEDGEKLNFYKPVANIDFPHRVDSRTDEEKIMDDVKFRLHSYGHINSRFYNESTERNEIPLYQLTYGSVGNSINESELRSLLVRLNYTVEECVVPETNCLEPCVIYEPEMPVSRSDSDTEASGYESDNKCTAQNEDQLSDWGEVSEVPSEINNDDNLAANAASTDQLNLESNTSDKPQGTLYDSGYQKSPLNDESPKTYLEVFKQVPVITSALNPPDAKPGNQDKPNKLSNIHSVFDKFSVDKVNELDAFRKEKRFFNFSSTLPHKEAMKKICQEIAKHPIAGPSNVVRKKLPKKLSSPDSDDSNPVEDAKSIANCIIENTLNKLEVEEVERDDLIEEVEAPGVPPDEVVEPVMVVENGDLANNNRDLEGNNYPAPNEHAQDLEVDNREINQVNVDNNNDVMELHVVEEGEEIQLQQAQVFEEPLPANIEVAWSSREALFDSNSQVDLLEDFEMESAHVDGAIALPSNFVLVPTGNISIPENGAFPPEENGFPNWLLQIFDEDDGEPPGEDLHDEPHFYCQGDGLGVHPSTIIVNDDDDDEDDGNESSSESSTSGSVDVTNPENTNSVQDVLVEAEEANAENGLSVAGHSVAQTQNGGLNETASDNLEHEEFFETAEEPDANAVTGRCS